MKNIRQKEYVDVLFIKFFSRHNMKRIQSKLHKIETYDIRKISLSSFDDKRYILNHGIHSFAYFHKNAKG